MFNLSSIVTVSFVVVGGVATRLYAPERTTDELDILTSSQHASRLYQNLQGAGSQRIGDLAVGGSEWRLLDGTSIDVLESDAPWVREAMQTAVAGPEELPIVGLPHLVLMKMAAIWGIDIGDLTRMLGGASDEALTAVRGVIGTYVNDAVEDLESFMALGRLEYEQAQHKYL